MREYLLPTDLEKIRNFLVHSWPDRPERALRILNLNGKLTEAELLVELNRFYSTVMRFESEEKAVEVASRYLRALKALGAAAGTTPDKPLPKGSGSRIAAPPGVHLQAFADAVFSPKTRRLVLEPTLRDLYDEYCEALKEGRPWKARWARARGYMSFWSAVVAQLPVSLARKLLDIWKAVS
jgi:hypothetical protein